MLLDTSPRLLIASVFETKNHIGAWPLTEEMEFFDHGQETAQMSQRHCQASSASVNLPDYPGHQCQ